MKRIRVKVKTRVRPSQRALSIWNSSAKKMVTIRAQMVVFTINVFRLVILYDIMITANRRTKAIVNGKGINSSSSGYSRSSQALPSGDFLCDSGHSGTHILSRSASPGSQRMQSAGLARSHSSQPWRHPRHCFVSISVVVPRGHLERH